ncbi:DNA cytosine methyltransferase [Xenorhabdus bovienii]|uniref:DNA (cytosine-5-)-methyltransferase n=1 Tax=Xenorhabdus bovienii str. feltiae Moldova TaxID=1398200 RepID=A0A077NN24_XENBV|nr:DNA cytosine methyltransferase [Xenorhabdus bovienii]CDG99788.1 putative modification methylase NmeDIP [Xenorhabdus bovienii str. feltiae Moldova]
MSGISSKPIIFSFFSGSGFLDLGFELTGFDIRFVNEFHKPFLEAYKYSRQQMRLPLPQYGHHLGSIEDFVSGEKTESLKELVNQARKEAMTGFIGGPPCPDFSAAGKHKGKEGENGKLTKVYVEAIIACQPDFFLFENVKGLWRTSKHRAFYDEMKELLVKAGYVITDRMTNCIEFGVPQDRDRILMFGIHKSFVGELSSDELTEKFNWEKEVKFNKEIILNKSLWPATEPYSENSRKVLPIDLEDLEELTVEYWFKKNEVDSHPNSSHFFKPKQGLPRFQSILEGDDSKKSFKRLHRFRYSPTAAYGNNEVHLHPYKTRRLSVSEALAIQSLPKEFHFPESMTLSDMFKTIGNGVPYLASEGVAKTILRYLSSLELK